MDCEKCGKPLEQCVCEKESTESAEKVDKTHEEEKVEASTVDVESSDLDALMDMVTKLQEENEALKAGQAVMASKADQQKERIKNILLGRTPVESTAGSKAPEKQPSLSLSSSDYLSDENFNLL